MLSRLHANQMPDSQASNQFTGVRAARAASHLRKAATVAHNTSFALGFCASTSGSTSSISRTRFIASS
eukprot:m.102248 g.102248  ORF g.102248 m.102248 type:complete len:68 (-) comp51534_c0_seq1:2877-3080(-)